MRFLKAMTWVLGLLVGLGIIYAGYCIWKAGLPEWVDVLIVLATFVGIAVFDAAKLRFEARSPDSAGASVGILHSSVSQTTKRRGPK